MKQQTKPDSSQKLTQKWAIISLLEDAQEGAEFYYTDFPLHVTLAGVFAIDKNGTWLAEQLAKILANQHPVEIEASEKAMFGPAKDIAVMKIHKSPKLMSLYTNIYEWLEQSEATYNSPQHEGEGYLPHSTFQKSGSLQQDEKRTLKSISLIDLYPNEDGYQRKISKTIELL